MKRIIGAALLALTFAAAGHAQSATTDPRVCVYGAARKADCARDAAKLVARRYLARQAHLNLALWQGPMACSSGGTMLKWRCSFVSQLPIGSGFVAVTYRATSQGWAVRAVIQR